MAKVTLKNISKKYKDVDVVKDVCLDIRDKEFLVLVGPSGCGKSTCLRMIAGLEDISSGEIHIGEKLVNDISPKDRDIAMVFQSYALYPHMTVYQNMAFGLRLRTMRGAIWRLTHRNESRKRLAEIHEQVMRAAAMLDLEHLLQRKPRQLSGGQNQRVALGRAIVREPQVFLMDEPLSNLDAKLRVQTRAELIKLHRRLGITTIYVTHDQVEAMTMGDRIAVLKDGVLQQCDTPLNLYLHPVNIFVAGFIGSPSMNFIDVQVQPVPGGFMLDAGSFRIKAPSHGVNALKSYENQTVVLGVRPSDIFSSEYLPPNVNLAAGNTLRARCEVVELVGDRTYLFLSAPPHQIVADTSSEAAVREEMDIEFVLALERTHTFDKTTGQAIY